MRAENHTQVRVPLDRAALRRALVRPGGLWRDLEVIETTGSTNADLLARALAGGPQGAGLAPGFAPNVPPDPAESPQPRPGALPATSLRAAGATALDRDSLLLTILGELEHWYRAWQRAGGDPDRSGLRAEYTRLSATIGRTVRAELPGGQALSGPVAGVDSDGRLLVRVSSGSEVAVAAGDVVHLR